MCAGREASPRAHSKQSRGAASSFIPLYLQDTSIISKRLISRRYLEVLRTGEEGGLEVPCEVRLPPSFSRPRRMGQPTLRVLGPC